jgi:carbamoyl-phosphate synthase large subunit
MSMRKKVNVLFSCVGRRVELIQAFRRAAHSLRIDLVVHGADASAMSPALYHCDRRHLVPSISSGEFVDALCDIVRRHQIRLLVPTIDTELPLLAEARGRLAGLGCCALVCSSRVVEVCRDKLKTFWTLRDADIDTPDTWPLDTVADQPDLHFPLYLKPRAGSAAQGQFVVRDGEELRVFGKRVPEPIVQEFVEGVEHTTDVYTGLDGVPRCAVPRRRLEVRTGEVSKGLVVKDRAVMAVAMRVAEVLGECRGVVTVQCMVTADRRVRVIEINPRFGGGVPLSIHAGADFPKWIIGELIGRKPRIRPDGFRHDVAMLRYDQSVFLSNASSKPRRRKM